MGLDVNQMRTLAAIVQQELGSKGAAFFAWVDPPVIDGDRITHRSGAEASARDVSPGEALAIYRRKLDGVYGERLVLAICAATAAVKAGKDVALLQIQDEPHIPFDASGWLVLAIEGHPMFHISPSDLPVKRANEAGLVTVVGRGTEEADRYAWKGTTKADELQLLLELL